MSCLFEPIHGRFPTNSICDSYPDCVGCRYSDPFKQPKRTNADRTDDLFKFSKWVAESVCVSDDKWEGDCWAFQEIACRMLVKLGIMEENDGVYSLKQEDEI